MNTVPNACDAVANDVEYHLACWVTAQREAKRLMETIELQEMEDPDRILADIEIIETVRYIYVRNIQRYHSQYERHQHNV